MEQTEFADFHEFVEKVLSRVDIVNVVSRYLPLKRKGKNYWACCPIHHEKTPSMSVTEEKQFFHCFSCKASGNAIGFVQKIESVDFMDALRIVAEMAKLEIPKFRPTKDDKKVVSREKKDRLLSLLREAGKHYNANLSAPCAQPARDYIEHRGLSPNIVRRFGLGYSDGGEEMLKYLQGLGYTMDEIKEAGIADLHGSEHYDVFYNRMMIPIINNFNEIVGFGGRLLDKASHIPVKYRNTSETPVFEKSKIIFAINLLKKKKQRGEPIPYVIMTEGYMDVMSLHQAGFDTAVASMGTALTQQQAKAIRNYSTNVYISYDGDSAGQKATMRSLDILADCGLNVKVVALPDGMDPDDLIKSKGKEAYAQLLKEALTLPEFKIRNLLPKYDLTTPDGKSAFAVEALKVVKRLENPVEKEEYLHTVHKLTGYSMDALKQQVGLIERKEEETQKLEREREGDRKEESAPEKFDKAELFVVASLVYARDYVKADDDVFPHLTSPTLKEIYCYAMDRFKLGQKVNPSALYTVVSGDAGPIVDYEFMVGDDGKKYRNCLIALKRDSLLAEKQRISNEYDQSKDFTLLRALQKVEEQLKQLREGSDR